MRRALAIWLTISLTTSVAVATEPTQQRKAPELPPLPRGLPLPLRTPLSARCVDGEGTDLGQGVWLPQKLAGALDTQREQCKQLPGQCQTRLDHVWLVVLPAAIEGAVNAAVAKAELDQVEAELERDGGDPIWLKYAWGVGGAVVASIVLGIAWGLGR